MPDLPDVVPILDDTARRLVFNLERLMGERMINIAGRRAAHITTTQKTHKQNGRYFTIQPRT